MPHKDPEKKKAWLKEYLQRNLARDRKARNGYTSKWRSKNPERVAAITKRYKEKHPEKIKAIQKYFDAMPERAEKRKQWWRNLDPERKRELQRGQRLRRKLRKEMNGGTCTVQQWKWRCELYGWQCAYCHTALPEKKIEIDHVIPMARGGTGWPANLVPCCRRCNARKGPRRWNAKLPMPRIKVSESG